MSCFKWNYKDFEDDIKIINYWRNLGLEASSDTEEEFIAKFKDELDIRFNCLIRDCEAFYTIGYVLFAGVSIAGWYTKEFYKELEKLAENVKTDEEVKKLIKYIKDNRKEIDHQGYIQNNEWATKLFKTCNAKCNSRIKLLELAKTNNWVIRESNNSESIYVYDEEAGEVKFRLSAHWNIEDDKTNKIKFELIGDKDYKGLILAENKNGIYEQIEKY